MKKGELSLLAFGIFISGLIGPVVNQAGAQNSNSVSMDSAIKTSVPNTKGEQDKISSSQAVQIALNANPNTTIKSIVVKDENGKSIYEVELSNKKGVKIDAVSGTILKDDQNENNSGQEKVEK